jgi:hypothetical protein
MPRSSAAPSPRSRTGTLVMAVALTSTLAAAGRDIARDSGRTESTPPQAAPAAASAPAPEANPFARDRESIFDNFYKTGLDTETAYAVSNLALKKDNVTILLKQGTVFLMRPIEGEMTGAAFVGDGVATMTPPNRMARYMLAKYSGGDTLNEAFTEAVFRFTDGSQKMLLALARPDPVGAAQAARASDIFKDRNGWLDGTRPFHTEMQFLESRISGLTGVDFFVADLHTIKHDWLTYVYDPEATHENTLLASETVGAKGRRYLVPWTSWHKQTDYDRNGHYVLLPEHDGPRVLRVQHTDLTVDLPTTKTVEWTARLRVQPQIAGLRCLLFDLDNNADAESRWWENFRPIKVREVVDGTGQPLSFLHRKDQLLVLLPNPVGTDSTLDIVAKGTADVIYQVTAESYGLLEDSWYPQYGYLDGRSTFDWTVRVPKPFLATGSGKVVREFEDTGRSLNGIELRCDAPVHFPWVIFGRFQKAQSTFVSEESKRSLPLTLHSFPFMTVTITDPDQLERAGLKDSYTLELNAPQKKIQDIFDEGKQVLKLYENLYGPYPYDELHIAQMAPFMGFGQSPQGFVQLTGEAFMTQGQVHSDFFHGFLAHEFAHQWWGHQVSEASGDDEWLSESFAEYASGIFVNEYQGAKRFQRTLELWKQRAKIFDAEAPIAAANTLRGPNAWRYREYLLYDKGPYVVHMLRVQLDDEKYREVMRKVQEVYKNRNISTEMLLAQINKVTNADYTFFFDQWFWGVGIPKFHYSWRSERQPDGKFLITVHVSQEDEANLKKVLMPIYLHFKGKTVPEYKGVVQAEQDIKILSPAEPKDVTLDDEHTLLADIVKAG